MACIIPIIAIVTENKISKIFKFIDRKNCGYILSECLKTQK